MVLSWSSRSLESSGSQVLIYKPCNQEDICGDQIWDPPDRGRRVEPWLRLEQRALSVHRFAQVGTTYIPMGQNLIFFPW